MQYRQVGEHGDEVKEKKNLKEFCSGMACISMKLTVIGDVH
jgi:hypothetical protein